MKLVKTFNISSLFAVFFVMLSMMASNSEAVDVTVNVVSDYGAVGDGITEDGAAIEAAIDYINSLGFEYEPTLVFPGGKTYVITGSSNFLAAEGRSGIKEGIKSIKHDNVTVIATGAEFIVPISYHFARTATFGDANDHFAQGFDVYGRNFTMIGGRVNGNLENRTIVTPTVGSGEEFGLHLLESAVNAKIFNAVFTGWGADSCYIYGQGVFKDCIFEKGRRLGVSVITKRELLPYKPVVFERCVFRNNSTPYVAIDSPFEAPGAGIDLECNGYTGPLHVEFYNCLFENNYGGGLILSQSSKDIIVRNCVFRDKILIVNATFGNATIEGNIFEGTKGYIQIYNEAGGDPCQPGCLVGGNIFTGQIDAVKFQFTNPWPNNWKMNNNLLADASATISANLQGTGHITTPNIQTDSTLNVTVDWDGILENIHGFGNVTLNYIGNPVIADELEAASKDVGLVAYGFETNFAFDTINVGSGSNGKLKLTDVSDDFIDSDEAVYTYNLNVSSGSVLDLNGIKLYYISGTVDGTVIANGGQLVHFSPADCNDAIAMGFKFNVDLDSNCKVDFKDFARLAQDWLVDILEN